MTLEGDPKSFNKMKKIIPIILIFVFLNLLLLKQGEGVSSSQEVESIFEGTVNKLSRFKEKDNQDASSRERKLFISVKDFKTLEGKDAYMIASYLNHKDPRYRGLACEILESLFAIEYIPNIAELLSDDSEALPNMEIRKSVCFRDRSSCYTWFNCSVQFYAREAIDKMTGLEFQNKLEFGQWWSRYKNYKQNVWYWRQRLYREQLANGEDGIETVRKEIARLSGEIPVKIILLADNPEAGGAKITGYSKEFFTDVEVIKYLEGTIKPERLLEILERKSLEGDWQEIIGNDIYNRVYYNRLAENLGILADQLFSSDDGTRLKMILENEKDRLFWSGKAALERAIVRLQPKDKEKHLISAIEQEEDIFAKGKLVEELISTSLPEAGPYVINLFFKEQSTMHSPDIKQTIIRSLGKEENGWLWLSQIVKDERFKDSVLEVCTEIERLLPADVQREITGGYCGKIMRAGTDINTLGLDELKKKYPELEQTIDEYIRIIRDSVINMNQG